MSSVLGIELPDRWSAVPLKHVTSLVNRGIAPEYVDAGPVRMVSQAANRSGGLDWSRCRFHKFIGDAKSLKGHLERSDVLVNSTGTGTLGRVGYFQGSPDDRPCVADGHVTVVRAIDGYDPRFLFYWLGSNPFTKYVYAALVVGATNQIELNREKLRDARVPCPPLDEQRRIADFLDAEISRIDLQATKLNQFDSRLVEREGAILQSLLGCNAAVPGISLPEGWCWTPLQHLTDPSRPIMYGIVLPGPNVDDGVPIVKGGDVAGRRLSVDKLNKTTREIESNYARSRLKGGDLVIAIRGSVGEVDFVPDELTGANLTQDAARISIGSNTHPRWLRLMLETPVVMHQIQERVTGATIKGINIWDLKRVYLPTPSRQQQQQLAETAWQSVDMHEAIRSKVAQHRTLLTERRQALITAAVTGQFDVSTASGRNTIQGV